MPMHEWNLPRESELARLDKLHLPIAGLLRQWDDGGDRDAALCARLREAFGQLFHQEDALIHRCGLESAAADGHLAEHQQLLEKIDTALSEPGDAAHDALRGALRHWRRRHRDSHDLLLRYAASSLEHEQQRQREAHQREWRCAHAINRLLAAPGELSTALQQIAELLPAGLGWPPACGIHLLFRQWHVCSEAYDADRTRLHIALLVDGQVAGDLELSLAGDETDSTFLATESERLYRLAQCLEQALEQRERRQQADRQNAEFRIAMENAADATIVTDTRGRLSYANNAACNLLGYTREHMLRLNLTDLSPPEEMPRHLREFQALQHNGFLRGEFRLRRQDGRSLIMELNGVPLPEQRYLISGRDITASTLAENALRESEDRFRTIVEATGDGILVSEKSSGRFIFANQAMCQMLGYTSGQLTGLSMPHIHPDSELPDIRKTMRQMNEGRLAIASEIPVKRRDGSLFYADVKSSPIRFGQTPCLMAVFRDVSERREAELLLKRHLDIQSLLGTLSTQLANDPIETLWDRLPDMLGRVGSMLHADRGCLIRLDRLKRSSLLTHLWQKTGEDGLPLPNALNIPTSGMDWLCGELERQGFLTVDADTSLPAEGGTLKALMRVNGSRSLLIAPLRQQQEISQLIIMDCQSDRHWLWIESRMLQSVAEMLAGSIEQYYRTLELTESRRRLLEAQRIARVGSWEWDILHDSMHWSEEVYSIAGLHAEQIDSSYDNFLGLIHPQDSKLVRQAINRSLERLTPLELEHRIIRPDGSERVVCQQAIVRVSDNGRALRMTGTLQDITEAKQKELLLRQSATVYENTLEGVMITDRDLSILDVNPAFSQITGYSRQEIIGKNPRVLQSGKHDHHFYQQIHESIRVTGHWQGEIWNRRKNGDIYPEWLTISAVYDDQRVVTNYVGVFSDISQIKKSESDLEKLAHFDSLTGLPNRLLFLSRLDPVYRSGQLQTGQRHPGPQHRRPATAGSGHPPEDLRAQVRHRGAHRRRRVSCAAGKPVFGQPGDRHRRQAGGRLRQALLAGRPRNDGDRQHRHQPVPARWPGCGNPDAQCRYRHVPVQGRGQILLPLLYRRAHPSRHVAGKDGAGAAYCPAAQTTAPSLATQIPADRRQTQRRRGAAALAPPGFGTRAAGCVHPAGGRDGAHHSHWRMDPSANLPADTQMAGHGPDTGHDQHQHRRTADPPRALAGNPAARAERIPPVAGTAGSGSHRILRHAPPG